MPEIKLKHIVTFSSEDPSHPADNLLKSETYRKWQCSDPGEKQVSVVIEFEKVSKIHSIDIGNNGAAFVEVLCGRSSNDSNDFQVLLVASSFMSPAESKSGTNTNRVRMFGYDKLSKTQADQKWDRIKFVCTQPYNKTLAYGLSFVKIHSPPEQKSEATEPSEKIQSRLGAFFLKDEMSPAITPGSLFRKKKENVPVTSSSSSPSTVAADLKEACKKQDRPATVHNYDISKKKTELNQSVEERTKPATNKRMENPTPPPPTKKLKVVEKKEIPLNEVLKNVIFVLSGFKNPERGHIRDKALAMGARYQGDWNTTCTHLVCAFINTPKYNQVKGTGKGEIVSKNWINDCHKRRKRLPERRYRLHGDGSSDSGSSTEEEQYNNDVKQNLVRKEEPEVPQYLEESVGKNLNGGHSSADGEKTVTETQIRENIQATAIDYKEKSDEEMSSGHNTEDEIRRVMDGDDDPYGGSTEDETDEDEKCENVKQSSHNLLELPDFLSGMSFLLYGKFEAEERRLLTRYVTAYDGKLEQYMSENVKYVITNEEWDEHFNEALVQNSCLFFVRPKWIYTCHEKRSFVPFQPFIVGPK